MEPLRVVVWDNIGNVLLGVRPWERWTPKQQERMLAEAFHGDWAESAIAGVARHGAALARRRQRVRSTLAASGAAAVIAAVFMISFQHGPAPTDRTMQQAIVAPAYEIISDDDDHQNLSDPRDEVNETDFDQQVHLVRARTAHTLACSHAKLQRFVRTSTFPTFGTSTESTKKLVTVTSKHRNAQRPSRATGSCGFELRGRSRNLLPRYRNEKRKIRCCPCMIRIQVYE